MVQYDIARLDLDNEIFRKTATYNKFSDVKSNMYGSWTVESTGIRPTPTSYSIKMQIVPQDSGTTLIKQGQLKEGDALGVFRYQYTEDSTGATITPTLTVKEHDEVVYNSRTYRIDKLRQVFDEDGTIICYECHLIWDGGD